MEKYLKPDFNSKSDLVLQNPNGKVRVLFFVDYTDDHTKDVRDILLRSTERFAEADYALALRVLAKGDYNGPAFYAAAAAIAADKQGRLHDMHNALFDTTEKTTPSLVKNLASQLGLDTARFEKDLHSEAIKKQVQKFDDSYEASTIYQNPAFFIDGQPYIGVWDEEDVMEALQKPLGFRVRFASLEFVNWAASSSILMIIATLIALIIANIGFHEQYENFIKTMAGITVGTWELMEPLEIWVNDGLMAFFFLLVGIEIKHEVVAGELSSMEKAAVPVFAAIGGMVVPALIYALINAGHPETAHGWGIPMATDIAFTLGILRLLGNRIPASLLVFVSALAIADDLGAIVVIAVFYGHGFDLGAFITAGIIFALMLGLNMLKFYNRFPYLLLGIFLWYFTFKSGVHATLAGVLTAFAIPSRPSATKEAVRLHARHILEGASAHGHGISGNVINDLQNSIHRLRDPGFFLMQKLQIWCNYLILPLFAFFNTGIVVFGSSFSFGNPEDLGTYMGLVLGKPLGICLAVWLAVALKVGRLSSEISNIQLLGASMLCGIGFTMSIFIAGSTFEGEVLETVKLSILLASMTAAAIGSTILIMAAPKRKDSKEEDEQSSIDAAHA